MSTSLPVSPNARLTAGKRKSTLVFAVNIAHVRALTKTFQLAGIDARYIFSGTPSGERVALIDAFKAGEFPVLLNCGKLRSPPTSMPCFTLPLLSRSSLDRRYRHSEYRLCGDCSPHEVPERFRPNG